MAYLNVDFDGVLSLGAKWPAIGRPNRLIFWIIKDLQKRGHWVCLYTCREGEHLAEALVFCMTHGFFPDAVNSNSPDLIRLFGCDCRKVSCNFGIDDQYNTFPTLRAIWVWLRLVLL